MDAHAATNSVSDYVDGKICLICDIEFQSPIIAINHAQINHLDVIDTGSSESKVAKIDEFEDNFDFDLDDEQIDNDNSASGSSLGGTNIDNSDSALKNLMRERKYSQTSASKTIDLSTVTNLHSPLSHCFQSSNICNI